MWTKLLPALGIVGLLAGCASTPAVPYWDNPQWINALAKTVHDDVHYPARQIKDDFPYGTAIVIFTYENEKLVSPHILKSTGSEILDTAIVSQIANITPPPAQGLDINTPHAFQMQIGLSPKGIELFQSIHAALAAHMQYPRAAIMHGDEGWVLAGFSYKDGIVSDSRIIRSSGSPPLDQAVLYKLRNTLYPKPPAWLKGKTLSFDITFCFVTVNQSCPNAIMQVRYVSTGTSAAPPKLPCAVIGYEYKHGAISNVHLIESSGNTSFDKQTLIEAKEGRFPRPSSRWDRTISDYTVPVCSHGTFKTPSSSGMPN